MGSDAAWWVEREKSETGLGCVHICGEFYDGRRQARRQGRQGGREAGIQSLAWKPQCRISGRTIMIQKEIQY